MEYAQKRGITPLVLNHGSAHLTMANPFLDFFIQRYEHMITNVGKRFDNRYITVSNTSVEWLKHFDINAVGVVNNSIDADDSIATASTRDFRKELGMGKDDFLVVFTGRLMKEKELLVGNDCGGVLADDSPHSVAEAILRFYDDREYLVRCSTNVAERVRENFTWNKTAEDLLELFEAQC